MSAHRQQQPSPQIAQISAPSTQTFTRTAPSSQGYPPPQYSSSSGKPSQTQYQQQQQQQAPPRYYASDSPRASGAQQQSRQPQPLPQQSQSGRRLSGGHAADSERMRSLLSSQRENVPSTLPSAAVTSGFSFYPSQQPQVTSAVRFSSAPRGGYR